MSFDTPILFIIFNRPDTTQIVFDQIRKIKPKNLFVAADGPRSHIVSDHEKCLAARKIINCIDWNCNLHTCFSEENRGCGRAVSRFISWFFDNVDEGIIIEDDCVPDLSFFKFCAALLDKYRLAQNVMMISGTSYFFNKIDYHADFYFSQFFNIWGWATWKRSWVLYDFEMKDWVVSRDCKIKQLMTILNDSKLVNFWVNNFDEVSKNGLDTWDYQWCYTCLFNHGFSANSVKNLVSNIGTYGAHSSGESKFFRMPITPIRLDFIKYPTQVVVDKNLEYIGYKNMGIIEPFSFKRMIKNYIKKGFNLKLTND